MKSCSTCTSLLEFHGLLLEVVTFRLPPVEMVTSASSSPSPPLPEWGKHMARSPETFSELTFFLIFSAPLPTSYICGWQDFLLRTLAVRNKGWDLQQYQDSSLSSVLLFSRQGQLELIEQTGTFFHFQASFYTDISAYTFHTFTNRYLDLLQKRSRVLTPCLHNYTLWPDSDLS